MFLKGKISTMDNRRFYFFKTSFCFLFWARAASMFFGFFYYLLYEHILVGHLSYTYSIVEHSVLGHAVRFAELLNLPSIVTEHHLLAKATAVGAGAQGAFLFEELLTVWGKRRKCRINKINNPKLVNESVKPAAADLTSLFTLFRSKFYTFPDSILQISVSLNTILQYKQTDSGRSFY